MSELKEIYVLILRKYDGGEVVETIASREEFSSFQIEAWLNHYDADYATVVKEYHR